MPIVKFFSWKLEIKFMNEQKEFQDGNIFVVVECIECGEMALVSNFGFNGIIPGLAVYSNEVRQCSKCMNDNTFKYMTSQ